MPPTVLRCRWRSALGVAIVSKQVSKQGLLVLITVAGFTLGTCAVRAQPADNVLVDAPGAHLVRGHCSACHSLTLVTAQRGGREFWLKTIRWMQAEQNLWPLPAEHEGVILNYLSKLYSEEEWGRRPILPVYLLPQAPLN